MADSERSIITKNTEYNMDFNNTTMESVVSRIEKKFNVNVVIDNRNVKKCRVTADFTDHSLQSAMEMISELLDIEYSIEKATVTITGIGCN